MLLHRQNSYVPRGKQRSNCREAHGHEPVNTVKKLSVETLKHKLNKLSLFVIYLTTLSAA
jgi:hypothetical protein